MLCLSYLGQRNKMEADTIDSIITNEGPEPLLDRFMQAPASTLVQEATQAVNGAAESINNFWGINPAHGYDDGHWFGYFVLGSLAAAAIYGVIKAIDNYKATNRYFMKSIEKAYDKKASGRGNKQLRIRAPRFKKNMESLFSDFDKNYQNKALRMVMEGVMQSANPYDTIRNVRAKLKPGMTGSEIVAKASKLISNGAEVRAAYDEYQAEEALQNLLLGRPA